MSAQQAVLTTAVINPGLKYIGTVTLAEGYQLLKITTNNPVRVQLYGTALAQSLDAGRALDVPPSLGTTQGLICDLVLDTPPFQWSFQGLVGSNADQTQNTNTYVTVTNIGRGSSSITLTFLYVPLESA